MFRGKNLSRYILIYSTAQSVNCGNVILFENATDIKFLYGLLVRKKITENLSKK